MPGMKTRMAQDEHRAGDTFVHFIDWLNHRLVGTLGPATVGPYGDVVEHVGTAVCPVCERPMQEHTIDHSTSNAVLNCPTEHMVDVSHHDNLNELGMPKHRR
jgi:hypothetical protein